MSDKLMKTEPGGESTQSVILPSRANPSYESIKTVTVPTHKSGGDLGGMLYHPPPIVISSTPVHHQQPDIHHILMPRLASPPPIPTSTSRRPQPLLNTTLTPFSPTEPETKVADSSKTEEEQQQRGEQTTDNIRYGQNISESGMGGMTVGNEGSVGSGADEKTAEETRVEQGYGGKQDMDREIGA